VSGGIIGMLLAVLLTGFLLARFQHVQAKYLFWMITWRHGSAGRASTSKPELDAGN
jgi:hypothetical protein